MKLLHRSINEYLLVIRQVLKVDLEDHLVVHVDNCGPTERAKSVSMAKSELTVGTIMFKVNQPFLKDEQKPKCGGVC
jgi:hypothetical protein